MTRVWEGFPGGGTELLALLALADWSDDDGRCYPSIPAIAGKTRLSTSQARRIVHKLISEAFVSVVGNEYGGPPGATRQYRINLDRLTACMDATPTACTHASPTAGVDARGTASTDARDGLHGCAETACTHASQTVSEPSDNRQDVAQARSSRKLGTETLRQFIDACKASSEKIIPDDDPVFDYADKVGIDQEMVVVCWREFRDAYLPSKKTQADWRAHFRNAVRRNWYKLWYLKDGEPAAWTTAGEQARRAAA